MPTDTGMEKISPPVRIFAILLVLLGLAGMLALRTMEPSVATESSVVPVVKTAAPAPAKNAAAKKARPERAPALPPT